MTAEETDGEGTSQLYKDLMAGFKEIGEYARGERELRVTTIHRQSALKSALQAEEESPYVVLFEQGPQGWSATVPDLPGCVSSGPTMEEAETKVVREMRRFVKAARSSGKSVPAPNVRVKTLALPT